MSMVASHFSRVAFSICCLPLLYTLVRADCECGYTVGSDLYTDLIETDFQHVKDIATNTDWAPQNYTVDPALARGPYGKNTSTVNVVPNPLKKKKDDSPSESELGGDAGIQLIVRGGVPANGMIPVAEMSSERTDLWYGSFRAGMKLTGAKGTCGAFFWYFNDTQEIDMEFLSAQFNETSHPVNLVLQSPESLKNGFDAAKTGSFDVQQLPFLPDEAVHEYRFDWAPNSVSFYADGVLLRTMDTDIPTSPGHITFSHWSNGDPRWSGGPPEEDAVLTLQYFKAYFNSSLDSRHSDWEKRCKDPAAVNATCPVPDIADSPDAKNFFFVNQKDSAENQTVSDKEGRAASLLRSGETWYMQRISTAVIIFTFIRLLDWCL